MTQICTEKTESESVQYLPQTKTDCTEVRESTFLIVVETVRKTSISYGESPFLKDNVNIIHVKTMLHVPYRVCQQEHRRALKIQV